MEYRGYDSAGIAMHSENNVSHLRTLGKVKNLEEKMIATVSYTHLTLPTSDLV